MKEEIKVDDIVSKKSPRNFKGGFKIGVVEEIASQSFEGNSSIECAKVRTDEVNSTWVPLTALKVVEPES